MRHFDRMFAVTNRLRTREPTICWRPPPRRGARRFIAQSYTGWHEHPRGRPGEDGGRPARPEPARGAARDRSPRSEYLERVVPAAAPMQGIVLRYGSFYGPGASERLRRASSGSGGCRSSATAPGSGRSCTSATPPRRRGRRAGARPARRLTTWWMTSQPGSRSGCRSWRRRSARSRPAGYRCGSGGSAPGGGGLRDDADPRLVERPGEAGARLAARMAELAGGLLARAFRRRASTRRRVEPGGGDDHGRDLSAAPAADVLDRLPDARQRQRGRGHRPGGVPALHTTQRAGRDRLTEGLPLGRDHPAVHRPSALGPGAAARPTSASGCPSRC